MKIPEDSTPVPKHVAGSIYHELCLMICNFCILLSVFVGNCVECKRNGMKYKIRRVKSISGHNSKRKLKKFL